MDDVQEMPGMWLEKGQMRRDSRWKWESSGDGFGTGGWRDAGPSREEV